MFNLSVSECEVLAMESVLHYPCAKRQPVRGVNNLRPVALTSCVMEVFERVVLRHFQNLVAEFIYPLQFAQRKHRSVNDAILHVLDQTYSHLNKLDTSIRMMYYDFSGAFHTVQPHLLADKLS